MKTILKEKEIIENEAEQRLVNFIERMIVEGIITDEMLQDKNFAKNIVAEYVKLQREKEGQEIKGVC